MMSARSLGTISLSRYRPFFYLVAGVAAAYTLVYIHNNVIDHRAQPSLRRRNAIRRQRRSDEEETLYVVTTPSFRAIDHLDQLEAQNGVYGTFRIETEDGRRVESGLLPSLLATRDQLMEDIGVPQAHAELIRQMMEDTFLESFLALDLPPSHTLPADSVERNYLTHALLQRGISRAGIERALTRFNEDANYGDELRRRRQNGERVTLSTSTFPDIPRGQNNNNNNNHLDGGETVVDDQSMFSWRDGNNEASPSREGQNLLNLLYHIAEDQARRDGYIHRGVTCNSCGAMPIQGIRYRCANCIDYDLCETCEAMQVHIKTHLFYKVRIPAPFLGNPRQSQPVWYPGKPAMLPRSLPRSLAKRLMKETGFENTELDALWDQFRCLANYEWTEDPNKLYMAIDRKTFDRCFVPNTSARPPPPSLIYDRMFAFYDTNGDGLVGFEEFLTGLASFNNKSADERLRRIFRGYDLDNDGYVERRDFLRMFRAYYTLSRELTRDMIAGMEDDFLEGGARDVVLGSQPISSAFPGTISSGEQSRTGEGKLLNPEGDMEVVDNEGTLRQDSADTGNQHTVVGDATIRALFDNERPPGRVHLLYDTAERPGREENGSGTAAGGTGGDGGREGGAVSGSDDGNASTSSITSANIPLWALLREEDIVNALGGYVPIQEVTDPVDRARIATAINQRIHEENAREVSAIRRQGIDERWRRRAFYIDEEDGVTAPPGYQGDSDIEHLADEDNEEKEEEEDESSVDDDESHPPSPRSRSSSKVRFQDDLADDYDVRSNPSTSSRSITVGERWGGFEIPEVERDVGKEILYQVTQQGFNELLDSLFKPREDLVMEAYRTRAERKTWALEIEALDGQYNHRVQKREAAVGDVGEGGRDVTTGGSGKRHPENHDENLSSAIEEGPLLDEFSQRATPDVDGDEDDGFDDLRPTHLGSPSEQDIAETRSRPDVPDSNSNNSVEPARRDSFDPTLPQFRSNDDEEEEETRFGNSPLRPDGLETSASDETAAPPPPPKPTTISTTSMAPASASSQSTRRPTPKTLLRWAFLNRIEREAQERGGSGARLSFDEFSSRMNADRARRLAFVGSWIEMASF